jgi:hypothetical protein
MPDVYDFSLNESGELDINTEHDIDIKSLDDLRIQMAYTRIKSVANGWYVDHIGADLEEIIGRPCSEEYADIGKNKILDSLVYDELWDRNDVYIKSEIVDNKKIKYYVYLRTYQDYQEDVLTTEIIVELDLIRGINIRYTFG